MSPTLIIGEMGSTPEGDYDAMIALIHVAAECQVDCVKNQWTSSAAQMVVRRHAPAYFESYQLLQYPLAWHRSLREVCHACGLQYACTAYLPGDAARLAPFVDYLKVSSFEAHDQPLVNEAVRSHPQTIVSLGMGADFTGWMPWAFLHCCSCYPAPLPALNLRTVARSTPPKRGFSDHSRDCRVGAWAVCVGAEILETHFRLDACRRTNCDYAVAFTPAELRTYVRNVRDCEIALGDGIKRIPECEQPMCAYRAGP